MSLQHKFNNLFIDLLSDGYFGVTILNMNFQKQIVGDINFGLDLPQNRGLAFYVSLLMRHIFHSDHFISQVFSKQSCHC